MTVPGYNVILEPSPSQSTSPSSSPSDPQLAMAVGDVVSFSRQVGSRDTLGNEADVRDHAGGHNDSGGHLTTDVVIYRLRPDLSWGDVVHSFISDNKHKINGT